MIIAWAMIFMKAGMSRWLCFLMIVPVINLITFFIFAHVKWPIHEYLTKDWRVEKLKKQSQELDNQKQKLEQELKSLSEVDSGKQNKTSKHNNQLKELRQQYELATKLMEESFLASAKCPDNSPEEKYYWDLGVEHRQKAEALEKQLDRMQGY
jgi:uncharacterized protein YlxW (UPF0749 family)